MNPLTAKSERHCDCRASSLASASDEPRELQNLIERAVLLSTGPVLRVPLGNLRARTVPAQDGGKYQTLEQAERAHILATVKETNWVLQRRGHAPRSEPLDSPVPHEKARNRPSLDL
jgi:hypothetical protein